MASDLVGDLVKRTRAGDAEAYTELVRRFQDAVYATAYQTVLDFDAARDIAQEAFVRAYQALPGLTRPESFPAWIVRICRNLATDWQRRPERRWVQLDETSPSDTDLASAAAVRDLVNRALATLPNDSRLALALFLVDGYTYAEVANLTGVPVTTAKGRIERARRKLAGEMVGMVEDSLKGNAPKEGFTLDAVRASLEKAEEALKGKELGTARAVAEEALTSLRKSQGDAAERDNLRMQALRVVMSVTTFADPDRWSQAAQERIALAEARGDRESLADLMYDRSIYDSTLSPEEKEALRQQAVGLFEEMGRQTALIQALFFGGWGHLVDGEPERGFADLEKAREMLHGEPYGEWHACLEAAAEFERMTRGGLDKDRRVGWGAGCDMFRVDQNRLVHRGQPGYGSVTGTTAELARLAEPFQHLLYLVGWFPYVGPETGFEEEKPAFSLTLNPTHLRLWIETDGASVSTPAGDFAGCLLLRVTQTPSPRDADEEPWRREGNKTLCGEKWCWFARGVGPVAYRAERADGIVEHAVLSRFECPERREEWVPLVIGTRWEYVPGEPSADLDALTVDWLGHVDDDGLWYLPYTTVANRHKPRSRAGRAEGAGVGKRRAR